MVFSIYRFEKYDYANTYSACCILTLVVLVICCLGVATVSADRDLVERRVKQLLRQDAVFGQRRESCVRVSGFLDDFNTV
jgi:hypothetical protein